MGIKISYNAPVVLTFSLIAGALWVLASVAGGPQLVLPPSMNWLNPFAYLTLVGYIFSHADGTHLISNMSFILLLGPVLEEKYGSKKLGIMILLTALLTAFIHQLFFSHGLLGASGIVFMFIILVSFSNVEEGKIPLTFVLILLLFVGKEVLASFQDDNVSQFAHILGGVCGGVFGITQSKSWKKEQEQL